MNTSTSKQNNDDRNEIGQMISQHWPRYWIMEGTDVNNPLSKMGPFLVYKGIQGISLSLDVKQLKNGTLLLE